MDINVHLSLDQGLALAAAMEALRRINPPATPALVEIKLDWEEGSDLRLVTVFSAHGLWTVEVWLGVGQNHGKGWVRVFAPDLVSTGEFRQAELIVTQLTLRGNSEVRIGTLMIVPLPELTWWELPARLQAEFPQLRLRL